jgi:hypothetical protein
MNVPTTKHQQPLLLEHDKADLLDQLSERTRVPKQVLLREAVDELLAKYGRTAQPTAMSELIAAVKAAKEIAVKYKGEARGTVWHGKIDTAIRKIDAALRALP